MKTISIIACSCLVAFSLQACSTTPKASVIQSHQGNAPKVTVKHPILRSVDAPPNFCQVGSAKAQPPVEEELAVEEPTALPSATAVTLLTEVAVPLLKAIIENR